MKKMGYGIVKIEMYDWLGLVETKVEYRENYSRNGSDDCYQLIRNILLTQYNEEYIDRNLNDKQVDRCYSGITKYMLFDGEKIKIKRFDS